MKKLLEISPFIVVAIIIVYLVGLFATGSFDAPEEMTITSASLVELVETAKLVPAQYIQHGIAKSMVEGKDSCLILYYATVRPFINIDDIRFEVDHDTKVVTVILPQDFEFEITLLRDDKHPFHYFPADANNRTAKEIEIICKNDAKQKAEANTELIKTARTNLANSITALFEPILRTNGYTITIK